MAVPDVFYIESLGVLYIDVQTQKIFPDSKYFVDCVPQEDPAVILELYEKEKQQHDFNLKEFLIRHFIFPENTVSMYRSGNKPILEHLAELWPELTRQPALAKGGTLLPLPLPYVVPGGRFREIYYWDSYFTMLGLQVNKQVQLMQHMVDNFAHLIDTFGFIPNGNRSYYLSRSQPPFFTLMVELLAEEKGRETLLNYLPQIEKEYAFWMEGEKKVSHSANMHRHLILLPGGAMMNRYWDDKDAARPEAYREDSRAAAASSDAKDVAHRHIRAACESGWDFSSRWFKDGKQMSAIQASHIIPVDLNCLLLHTEEVLFDLYTTASQNELAADFAKRITRRKKAIQQYCWDEAKGFYFDYQFMEGASTEQFTLAGVYPLFFSLATAGQAAGVAKCIEEKFLQEGGLRTTLNNTGQQWDHPNGWAPLQWMAYKGLKNYGLLPLANEIKKRWMETNEKVYTATGNMMEKYDVADTHSKAGGGEYPNQDGFGWTNGVYLKMSSE